LSGGEGPLKAQGYISPLLVRSVSRSGENAVAGEVGGAGWCWGVWQQGSVAASRGCAVRMRRHCPTSTPYGSRRPKCSEAVRAVVGFQYASRAHGVLAHMCRWCRQQQPTRYACPAFRARNTVLLECSSSEKVGYPTSEMKDVNQNRQVAGNVAVSTYGHR